MMTEWVAKAEAALRTGQPNLAKLYMRRGLSMSPGGRLWLTGHDLAESMVAFGRALGMVFEPWQQAVLRTIAQTDYALAGPSKASS